METNTWLSAAMQRVRPRVVAVVVLIGVLTWVLVTAAFALIGAWGGPEQPDDLAVQITTPEPTLEVVAPTPTVIVEVAVPTPAPTPVVEAEVLEEPEVVADPTNVLGMAPDARYGYVASTNAWVDPVPCASSAEPSLVGVDIEASTPDNAVLFDARFAAAGSIQQLAFSADGRAAALLSCGEVTQEPWLQILKLDDNGRVSATSGAFELPAQESASGPYLAGWDGESRVRVYVYPNGEWHELTVDASTGEASPTQPRSFDDDFAVPARRWTATPDGRFKYREIDDPQGRPGCEGTGFISTIELDDGSGARPAFDDPDQVFATAADLHFGPGDIVSWRSSCEGFATPYVGHIAPDGMITDAHAVDVGAIDDEAGTSTEYREFRLTGDGLLVGLGARYGAEIAPEIALFMYDVAANSPSTTDLSTDLEHPP